MEMYDVVWNLCDLANMFDIDLEESFARKVELNNSRWESLRAQDARAPWEK
jgi:NTP pyrophosphatase (non-canonical NTP hydrolase)